MTYKAQSDTMIISKERAAAKGWRGKNMKVYYTSIYCNEDGAGEVLEHKTAEEARKYIIDKRDHLTSSEKKRFKEFDDFRAFEIEATAEQLEQIEAGEIAPETLETANIKNCLKPVLYYIIDKRDRNAEAETKPYAFEELKAAFQPPEDFPKELIEEWENIADLYDLREYLRHEAAGDMQPYEFEVENE